MDSADTLSPLPPACDPPLRPSPARGGPEPRGIPALDQLERAARAAGSPVAWAYPAEYVPAHAFGALHAALLAVEANLEPEAEQRAGDDSFWARLARFVQGTLGGVIEAERRGGLDRLVALSAYVIVDNVLKDVRVLGGGQAAGAGAYLEAWNRWTDAARTLLPHDQALPAALCREVERAARSWARESAVAAVGAIQVCRLLFPRFPAAVGSQPTLALWRNVWSDPDGCAIPLEAADPALRLLLSWRRRLRPRWRALASDPDLQPEPLLDRTLRGLLGTPVRRVPVCRVMLAGPPGCGKTRLHAAMVRDSDRFEMPTRIAWDPDAWDVVDARDGNIAPTTTSHGQMVLPAHREFPGVDLDLTDTAGEQTYLRRPAESWLAARSTTDHLVIVLSPEILWDPQVGNRLANLSLHARSVLKARPRATISLVFSKMDETGLNPLFLGRLLDESHAATLLRLRRAAASRGGSAPGLQMIAALDLARRIPDAAQREVVTRLLERSAPLWADILVQPQVRPPWSFNAYLAAAEPGLADDPADAPSVGACEVLADAICRWRSPHWPFWFAGPEGGGS